MTSAVSPLWIMFRFKRDANDLIHYFSFLSLEDVSSERPFAPHRMKPTDFLPLESEQLDRLYADPDAPVNAYPVSMGPNPCIRGFGREAQCCNMITEVLDLITADSFSNDEQRHSEVQRLNKALQAYLLLVMHQAAGTWGIYCGAMNITIGYVFHPLQPTP